MTGMTHPIDAAVPGDRTTAADLPVFADDERTGRVWVT
jgi:hypothetical protein